MSLIAATRRAAKHRGKSVTQLKAELDQVTRDLTRLVLRYEQLSTAYTVLQDAHDQVVAERDEAREQAAEATAEASRLKGENVALRTRVANLDPYRELQQPIGPLTRVIPVMPLHQAPIAAVTDPGHHTGDAETTITLPVTRPTAA